MASTDQVRIGQLLIDIDPANQLEPGAVIRVQGVMRGGRLQAQRLVPVLPFGVEVLQIKVRDYLQGSAAQGYRINGIILERVDADMIAASMRSQPLRLELRMSGAGTWQALRQLNPQNIPMGRPQAILPSRSPA